MLQESESESESGLRILLVTNLFPPLSYGGYEDLAAGAVRHWRERGHDVRVLCSDHRVGEVDAAEPTIARTLPMRWSPAALPPVGLTDRFRDARRSMQVWADELATFRPDVVSLWNVAALSLGPLETVDRAGLPCVAVLGNTWMSFAPGLDPFLRPFEGRAAPVAGMVRRLTGLPTSTPVVRDLTACFASEYLRQDHRMNGRIRARRTVVVPHGVATEQFAVEGDGDRSWHGRAIYVGRLSPEKGVATAIDAVAMLRREGIVDRFTIIGDGPVDHVGSLRERADEHGIGDRVHFAGPKDPPAVAAALGDADVLLFPPLWEEPFGIVPLEAMAAGVPVVSSATGGGAEMIEDESNGLTFQRADPQSLAAAVRRLATDPLLRQRLRENGRRTAAWLDRTSTYDDLLTWHRHVVDPSIPPPAPRPPLPPELR